jgi:hypothetical protein
VASQNPPPLSQRVIAPGTAYEQWGGDAPQRSVPRGVAVLSHHCVATRGVHKPDTDLVTSRMLGCFRDDPRIRTEFFSVAA